MAADANVAIATIVNKTAATDLVTVLGLEAIKYSLFLFLFLCFVNCSILELLYFTKKSGEYIYRKNSCNEAFTCGFIKGVTFHPAINYKTPTFISFCSKKQM